MAARTGRTPRAMRQREGNYEDPGVKGRATGITLAPRPLREDGMEETAGLFSSPEKSPPKPNGLSHHSTVIELEEDETMNIGSSMSCVPHRDNGGGVITRSAPANP